MENQKLKAVDALRYLKAGYTLYIISNRKKELFLYRDSLIMINGENKTLKINEYDFLSLYDQQNFYIDEEKEEDAVDMKRDEEYYSWRQ